MNNKLFVGSLAWGTTSEGMREFFTQIGNVLEAKVITDRVSGRSKGFGFVTMETEDLANQAVAQLNGQMLDGRAINVSIAHPPKPREERGFNNGGGNY